MEFRRVLFRSTPELVLFVRVCAVFEEDARKVWAGVCHADVVQRRVADDVGEVWWRAVLEEVPERGLVVDLDARGSADHALSAADDEHCVSVLVWGFGAVEWRGFPRFDHLFVVNCQQWYEDVNMGQSNVHA